MTHKSDGSIVLAVEAAPDSNAFTDAEATKLAGIEALADVTDATNVNSAGAVMESDYNANTVLAATSDDTPLPVTMAASTILARLAAGNIVAATVAQIRTLMAIKDAPWNFLSKTAAYIVLASDWDETLGVHISCDSTSAAFAVTLPAASAIAAGEQITVKDSADQCSTNNVTITPDGSDTIDNAASLVLTADGESYTLVCDGVSNWEVI